MAEYNTAKSIDLNQLLPKSDVVESGFLNSMLDHFHYQAFIISKNWKKEKKITEQYLHVKQDIFEIDGNDRGHDAFLLAMKQTIEPLYQIVNNQGYMIWNC